MGEGEESVRARRDFLRLAGIGVARAATVAAPATVRAMTEQTLSPEPPGRGVFEVSAFGAKGDGTTIDTPAINRAIEAAAASGGGAVRFAAGQYRIRRPESEQPWEAYQDYGHNHWHNSLIWGEGLHDVSIYGPGLTYRK